MSRAREILNKMTLEEKCGLLSGKGFWWTKAIDRLNVPEIMMCDGPNGLRKQSYKEGNETIDVSETAVCYPTASCSAASFDRELLFEEGKSIGKEMAAKKVSIVLGPGVNMKRNALCGRNFEYFSEDPYLAGEMGANWVSGVRSTGGYCSLKHFACNNQERYRMVGNAVIDERTLREIYLAAFERVAKEQPGTVMCCYNRVNGRYGSENKHLLTEVLRDDWGYNGIVMTDWGAVADRVEGLKAGLDLEMPSSFGERDYQVYKAIKNKELDEEVLNKSVERLLELIISAAERLHDEKEDFEAAHAVAEKIAEGAITLLKNDGILPLKKSDKTLIIGEFAENHRFQGAGSSMVNAYKKENLLDSLKALGYDCDYALGYDLNYTQADDKLIAEAVSKAASAEKIVIVCGLTNLDESEGYDRETMKLSDAHLKLIDEIVKVNKNTAIVLLGGSTAELDFADQAAALVNCYLAGEAGGLALANVLVGKVNPSGRLAETIPIRLSDAPSIQNFPGSSATTEYREGLFIGYRYFDTANVPVRYPFGYGLSYTKFEYISAEMQGDSVMVTVKNVGDTVGKEVVQVYVGLEKSNIFRAKKELKGFEKVELQAGEQKTVEIPLSDRSFSYFNTQTNKFEIEEGEYSVYVARNVRDVEFILKVDKRGTAKTPNYDKSVLDKYYHPEKLKDVTREEFESLLGEKISDRPIRPFNMSSTMEEISDSFWGGIFYKTSLKISLKGNKSDNEAVIKMLVSGAKEAKIEAIPAMTGGAFNLKQCEGIVDLANGKFFKGLGKLISGKRENFENHQ